MKIAKTQKTDDHVKTMTSHKQADCGKRGHF